MAKAGEAKLRMRNRIAHAAWAAFAVCVSLMLIFVGKGHPPPIIFLPVVAIFWVLGHIVIWAIGWLSTKGQRARDAGGASNGQRASWPISLRFVLTGTGIAACVGTLQIVVTVLRGKLYPFHDATLWTIMMVLWLVHGACFAGLLLRRRWSKYASMTLVFAWALLLVAQIGEQVMRGHRLDITAFSLIAGAVALLLWFGLHLGNSNKVKSFLQE
jgi:hypothetical protein